MDPYLYNLGLLFTAVASRQGERPALRLENGAISFAELDSLGNRIAHLLVRVGVGLGDVVALQNTKTAQGYGAMLACLKLGAAYVNLDENNPAARLEKIFETCMPRLAAADSPPTPEVAQAAASRGLPILDLPGALAAGGLQDSPPEGMTAVTGTTPAYIMFTSGSSGTPKGVLISHANVCNFVAWGRQRFEVTPGDVFTNLNPIYFDNSVFDFYVSLFNGAALAPIPRAVMRRPRDMLRLVDDLGCTIWFSVPSLLVYLAHVKVLTPAVLGGIRAFVFGGEGFPKPALRNLYELYGSRARLVNVYGPTECTCICSARDIVREDLDDDRLAALGDLAPNFSGLVLDEDNRPSSEGELCLLGPQVGIGYCADPARTALSFVPNPLNSRFEERMYRTGDIVRREQDGLHFLCRKDNQIKHMGYRIELDEIEAAVSAIPSVRHCAVAHGASPHGLSRIVGFLVADPGVEERSLREALKKRIPEYMIPTGFVFLEELPTNANGKVDRLLLKEMAGRAL